MKTAEKFRGCFVAIVTPFTADGKVDEPTMQALVDWHLEAGIDGIVACGTTGETPTLGEDDYRRVMELVIDRVAGRKPVICGIGTNDTRHVIRSAKLATKLGADALLTVTPYYNKPTQQGLFEHYRAVAESVKTPIILYNVPGRTGVNMKAETTLRLAEIPNIIGTKEACGDLVQVMEILRNRPADFLVLSGDDVLALPMVALGGDGVISVVANEIPAEFTRLTHAALQGEFELARRLQNKYLALMQLNFLESNPIPVKTAVAMMGRLQEKFRLPLVPMQPKNRETLAQELKKLELIK